MFPLACSQPLLLLVIISGSHHIIREIGCGVTVEFCKDIKVTRKNICLSIINKWSILFIGEVPPDQLQTKVSVQRQDYISTS